MPCRNVTGSAPLPSSTQFPRFVWHDDPVSLPGDMHAHDTGRIAPGTGGSQFAVQSIRRCLQTTWQPSPCSSRQQPAFLFFNVNKYAHACVDMEKLIPAYFGTFLTTRTYMTPDPAYICSGVHAHSFQRRSLVPVALSSSTPLEACNIRILDHLLVLICGVLPVYVHRVLPLPVHAKHLLRVGVMCSGVSGGERGEGKQSPACWSSMCWGFVAVNDEIVVAVLPLFQELQVNCTDTP